MRNGKWKSPPSTPRPRSRGLKVMRSRNRSTRRSMPRVPDGGGGRGQEGDRGRKGEAINPGNYATIEVARALAASGMKLVPDVVAGGGGGNGGTLVDVLLAQLITSKK